MNQTYNVLGITAGNGVCLYPFKNSKNFNIIGNIEPRAVFYDALREQWEANFKGIPMLRQPVKMKKRVDVIIGHPDCGDSSVLRMSRAKKKGDVKGNLSINLFLNSITEYQPKFALMENLPGFLESNSIEFLEGLYPNYRILHWILPVSHWGNSQVSRKRLVVVWINKKLPKEVKKYFKVPFFADKSKLRPSQTFELGFKEDISICHVREPLEKTCNLYRNGERKITYHEALIIWNGAFQGKGRWEVGGSMKNQPGVTRNLDGEYPLTVRKQNRQFGTIGLVLSPREMANIQGVPVSFKLVFHEGQRIYWLNKSRVTVTKTMPFEIANWFFRKVLKSLRYCNEIRATK